MLNPNTAVAIKLSFLTTLTFWEEASINWKTISNILLLNYFQEPLLVIHLIDCWFCWNASCCFLLLMVWAVVSLHPKCSLLMACLRTLENFESSHLVSLFFFFFVGRIFWHLFPLLFLSVFFHFFFLFTRRLETVLQEINGDSLPNGTIDCCLFALFSHIKVLFFSCILVTF